MKNNHSLIFAIGILIIISLSWIIPIVSADDTGWRNAGNFYFVYDEFDNMEEAFVQDDTYATGNGDSRRNEADWYEYAFEFYEEDGCPVINGIEFRFDAYASTSGLNCDIKLTWNSGSSWTSAKTSSNLPTSDTDTYIVVGGASDTWGRSWTKSEFAPTEFGTYIKFNSGVYYDMYLDHIQVKVYYTLIPPIRPDTVVAINKQNHCNQSDFLIAKGVGADTTLVKISNVGYPTFSTGLEIYNGSGNSFVLDYDVESLTYNDVYYICAWSWNDTYCLYSENEIDWYFTTPCKHTLTVHNNTAYTDNGYETSYSYANGWDIWLNYTGILPILNTYENIGRAYGTHENNTENGGHTINVWANYTSGCWFDETYNGNVSGWSNWAWIYENGTYQVFTHYNSDITLYEDITDATGSHELLWNGTHYKVWANYSGSGASCDLQYFNYSDDNITINITYYGCNNTNTSDYEINNESWLYTAGTILFDNGQVFLIILISLWVYFVNKYYQTKDALFVYIQLGVVIPLTILISIIAFEFVFGYIVVFILPAISIYLFIDKYEKDKKLKEELEKRGLIDD